MNKLLLATIIFFASYAGTVAALAFLARRMYTVAAASYGLGWLGWGIAFLIGGHEFVAHRKKYKQAVKNYIKRIFMSNKHTGSDKN